MYTIHIQLPLKAGRFVAMLALTVLLTQTANAQQPSPTGNTIGSSSNPRAVRNVGTTSTDITANVLANEFLVLGGGTYIVNIPATGVTPAAVSDNNKYDLTDYGAGHYVDPACPTVLYTAGISGTGTVFVTNTTSTKTPSDTPRSGGRFSGGLLIVTNPQTFAAANGSPSLVIDQNTTVAFDRGHGTDLGGAFMSDPSARRDIVNNGFLYSYNNNATGSENAYGSITASIAGTGVVTFENGNVLTTGSVYSGTAYDLNGSTIQHGAVFLDPSTTVVQSNITTFATASTNLLVGPVAPTATATFASNYQSFGADSQVHGSGIQIFTGLTLSSIGNSKKDFYPVTEQQYLAGFSNWGGFGNTWYIEGTMQMGDGRTIINSSLVNNGNIYFSNNTFIQCNIEGVGGGGGDTQFISTGAFPSLPKTIDDVYKLHAVAFDYSGTYSYDAGINVEYSAANYLMKPHVGAYSKLLELNGNLIIVNPGVGLPANHLILTSPVIELGITQIDTNAVLQLGDGTVGNRTVRSFDRVDGTVVTGPYSTSYGNGMVITPLNAGTAFETQTGTVAFNRIIDNGALVVDNTPGALDITQANTVLAPIMLANLLDSISGRGSVQQSGALALTLAGTNTFSGGLTVDAGSTLIVASPNALGAVDKTVAGTTGSVTNHGTLIGNATNHQIVVPGDYIQSTAAVSAALKAVLRNEPTPRPLPTNYERSLSAYVRLRRPSAKQQIPSGNFAIPGLG